MKIPKRLTTKWTRKFGGHLYTTVASTNSEKRANEIAQDVRRGGNSARATAVRVPDPNTGSKTNTHVSYIVWIGPKIKRRK